MDQEAVVAALRALESSSRLLRAALTDYNYRSAIQPWGGEDHVDEIAARLGVFEVPHLEHELQMKGTAVKRRIDAALRRGSVIQVSPRSGVRAAVYRWSGKLP